LQCKLKLKEVLCQSTDFSIIFTFVTLEPLLRIIADPVSEGKIQLEKCTKEIKKNFQLTRQSNSTEGNHHLRT